MTTSIAPQPPLTPPSNAPGPLPAGPYPAGALPPTPTRRGLLSRIARLATTTPGRLRVESVLVVLLAVAAGVATSLVVTDRLSGTTSIRDEAVPLIVDARQIQTSLAEANAAAATAFLAGGVENPVQRAIYEDSLSAATAALESAARLAGDDTQAHEALQVLNDGVPRYAGLIETARANNRQDFPVGGAYLNAATRVLESELYPATDTVANQAAESYRSAYDHQRGLSLVQSLIALILDVALILFLVYLMAQLRRRFKRTLNVPLAASLAAAVVLTSWLGYGLANQSAHLGSARTDGYEGTRLYLDARTIGFGAKADEARYLIARGNGAPFEATFQARKSQFDSTLSALDGHAASSARATAGKDAQNTRAAWDAYTAEHDQIVASDSAGDRAPAVELAQSVGVDQGTFAVFNQTTSQALEAERGQFSTEMDQAEQALQGLQLGAIILAIIVAAAAALGLQQRINEYR